MKKIILIFFMICFIGCNKNKIIESTNNIDDSYIEIIPSKENFIFNLSDNDVLLNIDEIEMYNSIIASKTQELYNINISYLSREKILNYINSYKIPDLPKYNNGVLINDIDVYNILKNRNIENINDINDTKKGIVINRTNLKSFPTDIHFYDDLYDNIFDRLQESEMKVNTLVIIMNESLDQKWLFVLTKTYYGWVKKEDIAFISEEDYEYFIDNDNFVIITTPFLNIENTTLDMGVKLPFVKTNKNGYEVVLPIKDKNGNLIRKNITISRDKAHIGYLPYTKKNVYIQSFKYEGVNYSWGSMNGVDCSSFVSNVYSTFGFIFPRNTSSQNESVGKIISLKGKTNEEKLKVMENSEPSLLYMKGHVLIYLGYIEGNHYVINASGDKNILKVVKEKLEESYYLPKLEKLVLIEKN